MIPGHPQNVQAVDRTPDGGGQRLLPGSRGGSVPAALCTTACVCTSCCTRVCACKETTVSVVWECSVLSWSTEAPVGTTATVTPTLWSLFSPDNTELSSVPLWSFRQRHLPWSFTRQRRASRNEGLPATRRERQEGEWGRPLAVSTMLLVRNRGGGNRSDWRGRRWGVQGA